MITYNITEEQRQQLMYSADSAECYRLLQSLEPAPQPAPQYDAVENSISVLSARREMSDIYLAATPLTFS